MELENLFISLGYSLNEFQKIRNTYPLIKCKDLTIFKNVIKNYKWLRKKGYSQEEIIKMTKKHPLIYSCSVESMETKIKNIKNFGYTEQEIIKISKKIPQIYSLSIKTIKQKIEAMKLLGYTQQEVIEMTKALPQIFSYSIESIKQKIEDLKLLGYTEQEVIKMTKIFPHIYGLSIETIKEKIEFYDSINMHDLPNQQPRYLMQSIDLSYARYHFYLDRDTIIGMDNYIKLFVSQKQFEKEHGLTKIELLAKYNYQETKEIENGRTL